MSVMKYFSYMLGVYCLPVWIFASIGTCLTILLTYGLFKVLFPTGLTSAISKKPKIHVKNFEPGKVYLFQFPSCPWIPCVSPFAMKVETFLRLFKIPYEVVPSLHRWSIKGQIPFIEYNGHHFADSNFIIEFLIKEFFLTDNLSDEEKAITRAMGAMLDNQTCWSFYQYCLTKEPEKYLLKWTFLSWLDRATMNFYFPRYVRRRAFEHGIGRHSDEEITEIGLKDWKAVSNFLGNKRYMFGDTATTLDCYVFANLCEILDLPEISTPHKSFIRQECENLVEFHERVKTSLWSDWDAACSNRLEHKNL